MPTTESLQSLGIQKYIDIVLNIVIHFTPTLLLAIITLLVGFRIVRGVVSAMEKIMQKQNIDASLRGFLESLVSVGLKALILISVATMIGVQTTSFVAILGAAGLAVGLALQGSLGNFAGGVIILLFKPFRVDDIIELQGYIGKVEKITIFSTLLRTKDNKTIILPNGPVSNDSIVNYSAQSKRRVDLVFGIGYGDDILKAKTILTDIIKQKKAILIHPDPLVAVAELAESSVNITVRVWCKTGDYWDVYFDMQETVKLQFDAEGISFPFPQRDVHMIPQQ